MKQYEADQQRKLFQWTTFIRAKYPEIDLMFHIPNGGSRNKLEAANLKKQGVKAGVPGFVFAGWPWKLSRSVHRIKYGKNKPTEKQTEWLKSLNEQGYAVAVCYGCDEASEKILKYLKLGEINE